MEKFIALLKYLIPLAILLTSLIIGVFFEKKGIKKLKNFTRKIGWQGTDIIVESLKGIILLWFGLAGASLALVSIPIQGSFRVIIQRILLVILLASVTLVISRLAIGFIRFFSVRGGEESPHLTSLFENLTRIFIFSISSLKPYVSLSKVIFSEEGNSSKSLLRL